MQKTVDGMPYVAAGYKQGTDEPDGVDWYLFRACDVPASDNELIGRLGMYRSYQGPGRPYTERGHVRRVGKRVLVTQYHGWDI